MNKGGKCSVALIAALVVVIVAVLAVFMLMNPLQSGSTGDSQGMEIPTFDPSAQPPSDGPTELGWCTTGLKMTFGQASAGSGEAIVVGMDEYNGMELCKANLVSGGETYMMYFNEDVSVWYLADSANKLIGGYNATPAS